MGDTVGGFSISHFTLLFLSLSIGRPRHTGHSRNLSIVDMERMDGVGVGDTRTPHLSVV